MFNILRAFKKASIYLVVLSLAFFPLFFIEGSVKTYAAGQNESGIEATEPETMAAAAEEALPAEEIQEAVEETTEEEALPEIDYLEIPEIRDARIDAQNTLIAKREDMDREWLELKKQEKVAAEQNAAKAKEAAAAKESSSSSSVTGDLGRFKLTAYCPCYQCSEGWGRMTSSGKTARPQHTIATDPRVIPAGTRVMINGQEYVAEDVGGGVKGNHIDIFFEDHSTCLEFGVRYAEVYKLN